MPFFENCSKAIPFGTTHTAYMANVKEYPSPRGNVEATEWPAL